MDDVKAAWLALVDLEDRMDADVRIARTRVAGLARDFILRVLSPSGAQYSTGWMDAWVPRCFGSDAGATWNEGTWIVEVIHDRSAGVVRLDTGDEYTYTWWLTVYDTSDDSPTIGPCSTCLELVERFAHYDKPAMADHPLHAVAQAFFNAHPWLRQ